MEPKDPSNKHFKISMYKSALRLLAALLLITVDNSLISSAGVLLFIAECAGIVEEL